MSSSEGGARVPRGVVEAIWHGAGAGPVAARLALAPAAMLYRGVVAIRNGLYKRGIFRTHPAPIPTVGIGNLTVGGTGKTPVSAWVTGELLQRGGRPAIVMRGYGGDEPLVHERLNPAAMVIVNANRVSGVSLAAARGADVAVLDDGFQHHAAARTHDIVLVTAEGWAGKRRLLPAGPWREPLHALRRADVVLVTRKSASLQSAIAVEDELKAALPGIEIACGSLLPSAIEELAGASPRTLESARGQRAYVVAGIGDPASFLTQVRELGISIEGQRVFEDHHSYTMVDAASLAAEAKGCDFVLCTLKDAVKLSSLWPREAPPLLYVSQRFVVERNAVAIDRLLNNLLRARRDIQETAGRDPADYRLK